MTAFMIICAVYAALVASRLGLARFHFAQMSSNSAPAAAPSVTIVQPILSGDPALGDCLSRNLQTNPRCHFLWLVDEDDEPGQTIAETAATANSDVSVAIRVGSPPVDGDNPKVGKLHDGLASINTEIILVLDDDTVLRDGDAARLAAVAAGGDIATGLPVYRSCSNWVERLVAGFINGQAIGTYFAMAAIGANRTVNGMVYAVRRADLLAFGGFDVIRHELTDDYAIARLWTDNGRRIVQTNVFADVVITMEAARKALSILRRWFVFANRYLVKNKGAATLLLVVVPTLLPLAGLIVALTIGWPSVAAWISVLLAKGIANGFLVQSCAGVPLKPGRVICELAADIAMPVIYATAFFRPSTIQWRNRQIDMSDGMIRFRNQP